MSNLMELTSQVSGLMEQICETDDPTSLAALETELRQLIAQEENKVGAIGLVLDRMERKAIDYRADADVFLAAAKRVENEQERLRTYVLSVMLANGIKSLKSPMVSFSVLPAKDRVEIYDEAAVPVSYRVDPKPPAPDKTKIKLAIASGGVVPGARITQGYPALSVRVAKSKAEVASE